MSTTFVITSDGLGRGDHGLGRRLMMKFVQQLAVMTPRPQVVAFYNAGVNLLLSSAPEADTLKTLEADGVDLIACGTCLEHYGTRSAIVTGRVSDMREIVRTMAASEKVVVV
jgi:intracellular sulfur oxidation DsrE/DsrF family protein